MNKPLITICFLLFCFTQVFATTDICELSVSPDPSRVASYALTEKVTVSMNYSTDEASGIRIFARPFTNGSLSPGYAASPSGLYNGSGTADSWFTITNGNVVVDEIRIEVVSADNSTVLRRFWIPVRFRFGSAGVNNFSFSGNPDLSSLLLNEDFTASFKYNITNAGGARIFIRPFTNGALTPGYGASGSGIYTGTGVANASFTITSGKNVHVDALRVRVTNADQTLDLDEFFIPVNLYFSTVKVTDIAAQSGNFPYNNDSREIDFNYATTEAGGVRIFPRPWTNGALTPNYAASGSGLYTGSGSSSGNFTITATNQRVDHVRFNVTNADQTETLLELWAPVEYTFGNFLVENIQLCPSSPLRLENGTDLNIHWAYYNDEGQDTRVFVRPFSNGTLSPGYAASGSGLYGVGTGSVSDHFTITSGDVLVDQLRFLVTSADQTTTFAEYFVPVHVRFGSPLTPVTEAEGVLMNCSLSPNPAVDHSLLSLNIREKDKVQISLFDLSGREIMQLGARNIEPDTPAYFDINTESLPLGAYFLVIKGTNFNHTERLLRVK